VLQPIQEAFLQQVTLQLKYQTPEARSTRTVEPHYLLCSWPAWYLAVWDHLRGAVRALRLDRIDAAPVLDTPFRLRNADEMLPKIQHLFRPL
jgi:predicted DNA-binding transcriptional regulator YafY